MQDKIKVLFYDQSSYTKSDSIQLLLFIADRNDPYHVGKKQ